MEGKTALLRLYRLSLLKPCRCGCIRWHAPVGPRRKRHRTDLRPIWKAASLELLLEEAAYEYYQPFPDERGGIVASECLARDTENLRWWETIPDDVIEEEIMELIWADDILSHL